jgi:TPR repeat protein
MYKSKFVLSAVLTAALLAPPAQAKDACFDRYSQGATDAADSTHERAESAFASGDYKTALVAWRSLAGKGDCVAQYNLGTMYLSGRGVDKDIGKGLEWFRQAGEQGSAKSQFNLGEGYRVGLGVDKNMSKAIDWYMQAADQGLKEAQAILGLIYDRAPDFPRDPAKAAYFYRQAAAQGEMPSYVNLGIMYALGDGVPADRVLAYFFVGVAASAHLPAAEKTLPKIRAKMSVEQIEEAEQLTRTWTPSAVMPVSSTTGLR